MPWVSILLHAASKLPLRCPEVNPGQIKDTMSVSQSTHPNSLPGAHLQSLFTELYLSLESRGCATSSILENASASTTLGTTEAGLDDK